VIGLDDLLGGGGAVAAGAAAGAGSGGGLGLDDLLGGGGAPAAPPTTTHTTFPPVVAYDKDGLTVTLAFSRAAGGVDPALTELLATSALAASAPGPVSALALQAAVPKYLSLKLEAASGTTLTPGGPPVTQRMQVRNSTVAAGAARKPSALRLRVVFARGDGEGSEPVAEVVELGADRLPAGL